MLHELFPDAKNVGILYCSAEPNSAYQSQTIQGYLKDYGYECTEYTFADSNDIASVVNNAIATSDVLYIPTDNTAASNTTIIQNICQPAGNSDHRRRGRHLLRLRRSNPVHQLL